MQRPQNALAEIVSYLRGNETERRQHASYGRNDYPRNGEPVGDRDSVQWTGAAESEEREFTRIVSPLNRDYPNRSLHGGIRYFKHTKSSLFSCDTERVGYFFHCCSCGSYVKMIELTNGIGGKKMPQHKVSVGNRWFHAAMVVTSWSRGCTRTLWPDTQGAATIDPGNASPSSPYGVDIDHGKPYWVVANLSRCRAAEHAIPDERDIAACPSHVERDQIVEPSKLANHSGSFNSCRRTGEEDPRRVCLGIIRAGNSSIRLHDLPAGSQAILACAAFQ